MKTRYIWMTLGVAFSVALAVVVGQRLSSEAMAVIVGVVAGVAASIPTSLIVVWAAARHFASRTGEGRQDVIYQTPNAFAGNPRNRVERAQPPSGLPQVIVVQPPAVANPPPGYPGAQYAHGMAQQWPGVPQPRQYTVVGGAEEVLDGFELSQEVLWQ